MTVGSLEIPEYIWLPLSIAGALILLLIRHWLQKSSAKSSRFASACEKYRATLLDVFSGLYPKPTDWPENIDNKLTAIFPNIQQAIEEFRPFLPWYKRISLDRAWFRYRCSTGRKVDTQCYHHYMEFGDNPEYKEQFRSNVSKLLKYAKKT